MGKRIAVLCSGGDSQGMNSCIKAIVDTCVAHDVEIFGINRGYQGLIENDFVRLTKQDVLNIETLAGSVIKTSRCPEFKTHEGVLKGKKILDKNKIDGLIVIGGDGSFRGCAELVEEGACVIGIPGTIDNDLFYTEKTLGFDTAVKNAVKAVDDIKQTMIANDRTLVVKCMGRGCGDIALYTAVAVEADSLAVVELNTTIADIIADVRKAIENGVQAPVVIMSESCPFDLDEVVYQLRNELHLSVRGTELGYIQRGGAPSVLDRINSVKWGVTAVELLLDGKTNFALGVKNDKVTATPLLDAVKVKQKFRLDMVEKLKGINNIEWEEGDK